jgi:cytochrome c-type biogenesis protein CcsB
MLNSVIFNGVTFIYLGAFVFYLVNMVTAKEFWGRLASFTALFGLLAHTTSLIIRWVESYNLGIGHIPLSNLYESLVFFAWAIMLLYLIVEWRTKSKVLGTFVVPFAFLLMAYASLSPDNNIQPLIPALQSNWLTSHVITCFMGYAAFTISCALSLMYLLKGSKRGNSSKTLLRFIPALDILDELNYQMVVFGFVFLTLGIITGAVWAQYAWGSYWSWDPKETWSLVTWFIYAVILHTRFIRGWRGKRIAIMVIIGFVSVLFTYLGVNYLPGLHSYQ